MLRIEVTPDDIEWGPLAFIDFIAALLAAGHGGAFECGVLIGDMTPIALVGMRMEGTQRFCVMSAGKARETAIFCRQNAPDDGTDKARLALLADTLEGIADQADAITGRKRGTLH